MSTRPLPAFITFTGVDDDTSIYDMHRLSSEYRIEWGVLFSPKRQGSGRYPSLHFIEMLLRVRKDWLTLSAHLCGGDARAVIEEGASPHDAILRRNFRRSQINTADPHVQPTLIGAWAARIGLRAIMQCRGSFPRLFSVDVLFDASGGRGISPSSWPAAPEGTRVGYAGGLNPANVAEAVQAIGQVAPDYWIDMETGVRDDNDRFCLDKCRAVCEAVYGNHRNP